MSNANQIIRRPLVTEKSTMMREDGKNILAFEVDVKANKIQVKQAVEELFGVKVDDVRTMNRKGKPRRSRYKLATTSGWKKESAWPITSSLRGAGFLLSSAEPSSWT